MMLRRSVRRSSSPDSPCTLSGERGRRTWFRRPALLLAATTAFAFSACAYEPPDNPGDACAIFEERRGWWDAVRDSEDRWDVPPEVQLAILNQESSFDNNARPPRRKLLFVIPTPFRESSSYGFAQATRSTWDWYKDDAGRPFADRDSFRDAADFVGWYGDKSRELSGISPSDARSLYLAYHEGHGGYNRRSYRGKRDVNAAADRVASRAAVYRSQLDGCRRGLDRRFLFFF